MITRRFTLAVVTSATLAACSSTPAPLSDSKINFQSATSAKTGSLEVPPDLTEPNLQHNYLVPSAASSVSALAQQQATPNTPNSGTPIAAPENVAVSSVANVQLERAGTERWLAIKDATPEQIWPKLRTFWQDSGFIIKSEDPKLGLMETDWAENRAKLPQDGIRSLLSKVGLDGIYSTPERDKFRARIERTPSGCEVYFSNSRMFEVYTNKDQSETRWEPHPADTELEAEMLGRFMLTLGVSEETTKEQIKQVTAPPTTQRAQLQGDHIVLGDEFDRAWRRTGLALDRIGLIVTDRNRAQGIYYVRPAKSDTDKKSEGGFLSNLFSSKSKQPTTPEVGTSDNYRYQVQIKTDANNGSTISFADKDGGTLDESTRSELLNKLLLQLQ